MKFLKFIAFTLVGYLAVIQLSMAQEPCDPTNPAFDCGTAVPEIDGSGAIIAIGLVIGLVALVREKFYHK